MEKASLNNGVVLVTGASSGMGKDFAFRLLQEGYVVYAAARRLDKMADLIPLGGIPVAVDVTNDASMIACVECIIADHGQIDVLISNAGYGQCGAIEDVPIELARRQMEVNLIGLARLTQLCLPHMRARKTGRIINISSIGGRTATPVAGWYHASKFALEGWSDALRNEVRSFGIDVVVIQPGGVHSEWASIALDEAMRISGEGAYRDLAQSFVDLQRRIKKLPPPSVITELVVKAISAKRPRTRYIGGYLAKPVLLLRYLLPDRIYDRLMMSAFQARPKVSQ